MVKLEGFEQSDMEREGKVVHEGEPEVITRGNVIFWSKHYKEMTGSIQSKSLLFVDFDCIKYVGDQNEYREKCSFICLPLNEEEEIVDDSVEPARTHIKIPYHKKYNNSIYTIVNNKGRFVCNCQGWHTVEKGHGAVDPRTDGCQCAHVLSLFLCFKLKKFGNKRR